MLAGGLVGNVMLAAAGADLGSASMNAIRERNLGEYVEKSKELLKEFRIKSFFR